MPMIRIKMPRGHTELCLEGHTYTPDEDGAFEVPDTYWDMLHRSHGAERAISLVEMEDAADAADARVAAIKAKLKLAEDEAAEARKAANNAKLKLAQSRKRVSVNVPSSVGASTENSGEGQPPAP